MIPRFSIKFTSFQHLTMGVASEVESLEPTTVAGKSETTAERDGEAQSVIRPERDCAPASESQDSEAFDDEDIEDTYEDEDEEDEEEHTHYWCHSCRSETTPIMPTLLCSHCNGDFIEALEGMQ